jgi:hypothetical protein
VTAFVVLSVGSLLPLFTVRACACNIIISLDFLRSGLLFLLKERKEGNEVHSITASANESPSLVYVRFCDCHVAS